MDVDHAVLSMFFTIRRLGAAIEVKVRLPHAELMQATGAANVHHAVLRMLPAVRR